MKPRNILMLIGLALLLSTAIYYLWWKRREDVQIDDNIDLLSPNITIPLSPNITIPQDMSNPASGSGTRGIRNNNPGNIRISSTSWQQKVPLADNTDGSFEQFYQMVYGCRAMLKVLLTYINSYHLVTIPQIINRWAPAVDNNNPTSYANTVSTESQISQDYIISSDDANALCSIAAAMAIVECGRSECENAGVNYSLYMQAWGLI